MKIFRVTEIISPYQNFEGINPETLQRAADRGTAVHAHLSAYLHGLYSQRPKEAEGYCESGERWIDQNVKTVISAEREYTDPVLRFCGHPDLLMKDQRGAVMLVDYKTPINEAKSWSIQLAAYHHLVCKAHKLKKTKVVPGALMLSPAGANCRFKSYYEQIDFYFSLFLSALNLIRYFKEE